MSINPDVRAWRAAGKHLPQPLRDFHDQKAVFKLVHELTEPPKDALHQHPSWVDGHIYVIDTFLWCMARHGYTLQRSRAKLPFESLESNIQAMEHRNAQAFASLLTPIAKATTGTSQENQQ